MRLRRAAHAQRYRYRTMILGPIDRTSSRWTGSRDTGRLPEQIEWLRMKQTCYVIVLLVVSGPFWQAHADDPPKHFSMGDFVLESGAVIKEAVLSYRTAGQLDEEGSNVALVRD